MDMRRELVAPSTMQEDQVATVPVILTKERQAPQLDAPFEPPAMPLTEFEELEATHEATTCPDKTAH